MIKLTKEKLEELADMGALGYSVERIATILNVEAQAIELAMSDEKSQVSTYYNLGKQTFQFTVDRKLMAMAAAGDIKALEKLEQRQQKPQQSKSKRPKRPSR